MSVTVAILQPSYLPWAGYFGQMAASDHFVFYDDVQYDKHGWRNRNQIKTNQKEPLWLTVPVLHRGLDWPLINQIQIDNNSKWAKKHLLSIQMNYAKAPFFKELKGELEALYTKNWDKLLDLNVALTTWMAQKFEIKTPLHFASQLNISGDQTGRLVSICKHFSATRYLSGAAAKDYLDVSQFTAQGIEVVWQDFKHPTYPQLHGDFVSHLSALDMLLNVGPDSASFFLKQPDKQTNPAHHTVSQNEPAPSPKLN